MCTWPQSWKCCSDQAIKTLCAAAQSDSYLNVVRCLLQAETDINGLQHGMTPLMHASIHGSAEIVNTLLRHKASVDYSNNQQETSLLLACRSRQWKTAKVLVDYKANALHSDVNNQTPLHAAFTNGGVELVQYMVARQPPVFQKLKEISSLSDACQFSCDVLIEMYPNLSNEQINEVTTQACLLRNTSILQHTGKRLENDVLLKHISQAYQTDHFECLDVLLKCAEGRRALPCPKISLTESCKRKELVNLMKFLVLKGKKNINEDNGEPLRVAARCGNVCAVEFIVQNVL